MKSHPNNTCRHNGFTMIESLLATAVTAVAVGAVAPGFVKVVEQRHLEGAAAQLQTDMHFARSLAVAQSRTMRLSIASNAEGSCYIVYAGKAADCSCTPQGGTQCLAGITPARGVGFASTSPVQVKSNVGSIVFDPTLGTVSPTGTLRLLGNRGREVRVVVNIAGRIRTCTPSPDLRGYAKCPA